MASMSCLGEEIAAFYQPQQFAFKYIHAWQLHETHNLMINDRGKKKLSDEEPSSVMSDKITCMPHTAAVMTGGVQPIQSEHIDASQFNSMPQMDTQENSQVIFIAENWEDLQSEEIIETSVNLETLSDDFVQSQYSTGFIPVQSEQQLCSEIEPPNTLTPPLSTSSVLSNEAVDMSQGECSSSEIDMPDTVTSPYISNEPQWNSLETSQPGCSKNYSESFAEVPPVNIQCIKLEQLLQEPQAIKQENINENDTINTVWLQMNEEIDIPLQNDKKEQNNLFLANQIIKQFKQESNQPKIGILGRKTYNKKSPSLKIKSSKKHCKIGTAPYFNKNVSDIEKKKCYNKNEVRFINEDNELVVCKYNPHSKPNFDNLYSKKFPKLTVTLTRLKDVELILDSESKHTCDFCFIVFESARKLSAHLEQVKCRAELAKSLKIEASPEEENKPSTSATESSDTSQSISEVPNSTKRVTRQERTAEASSSNAKNRANLFSKDYTKNEQKYVDAINLFSKVKNNNFDVCTAFFCKKCYISFQTVDALVIHKRKYHFNTLYKFVDKMFPAPTVKSERLDKESNQDIKKEDEGIKVTLSNECYICGFKAVTTCHLEFHMKLHKTSQVEEDKKEVKPSTSAFSSKVSDAGKQVERLDSYNRKNKSWYPLIVPHDSQQKVLYKRDKSNGKYCYSNKSGNIKSVPRYVCTVCSKMYRGLHSFNDHTIRVHIKLVGKTELLKVVYIDPKDDPFDKTIFGRIDNKKYKCHVCGIILKSKLDAQNHMISNHCDSESD